MRKWKLYLALNISLLSSFATAQWTQTSTQYVTCFGASGPNLYAAGGGISLSTDNGTTWAAVGNFPGSFVSSFAVIGTNLFAGTWGLNGVYRYTDSSTGWTVASAGLTNRLISSLAVINTNLLAGTEGPYMGDPGGVFSSGDSADSWTRLSTWPDVSCFCLRGTDIYAGTDGDGVCSSSSGLNWTRMNSGLTYTIIDCLAASGTNLFAGTQGGGVFRWDGARWTASNTGFPFYKPTVYSLAASGTNVFAGTDSGVYVSTNSGASWTAENASLPNTPVISVSVSGPNLIVGVGRIGDQTGVWRRPISEMTGVRRSEILPTSFAIAQNYPNPFNPSTTIRFELPRGLAVRLSVFDLLGREVSVLVNEKREAGVHEVNFDAAHLSSGVYIYRLQAGNFVQSKKLVLVK